MSQTESSQGVCFRKEERKESWETDLLGRKDAAHQLERLIANAPGPYVIAMTSEWGSGKTFFLKAWEKDLRARHRPCVYFNAWETDHAGDPLLALTGCITNSLKKQKLIKPRRLNSFKTTASKIVSQAPGTFSKLFVGLANHYTDGALEDVKEVVSDTMKLGTDLFLKNNARRKGFTKQLAAIAKEATDSVLEQAEDPINGTNHFPLFVMIDELDRCRPSYVIELLENIKHLFGVPGVVFLLAIDQDQILGIIQHTFGLCSLEDRDVRHDYLQKFIDVFWQLPEPDNFEFVYTKLLEKSIMCPKQWPNMQAYQQNEYCSLPEKKYLNYNTSFYASLAKGASMKKKSLREYIQLIEKFNIISSLYTLDARHYFVIFYYLLNETSETEKRELLRTDFTERSDKLYRINARDSVLLEIYTCMIENTFSHARIELSGGNVHSGEDFFTYKTVNAITNEKFSGAELAESVKQKLNFLDTFHFGTQSPVKLIRGTFEEVGHE